MPNLLKYYNKTKNIKHNKIKELLDIIKQTSIIKILTYNISWEAMTGVHFGKKCINNNININICKNNIIDFINNYEHIFDFIGIQEYGDKLDINNDMGYILWKPGIAKFISNIDKNFLLHNITSPSKKYNAGQITLNFNKNSYNHFISIAHYIYDDTRPIIISYFYDTFIDDNITIIVCHAGHHNYNSIYKLDEYIKIILNKYNIKINNKLIVMGDMNNILNNPLYIYNKELKSKTTEKTCCDSNLKGNLLNINYDHILISDYLEKLSNYVKKPSGDASDHLPVIAKINYKYNKI
jgi:hypothetical protein